MNQCIYSINNNILIMATGGNNTQFLNEKFVLCHRDFHSYGWKCECGLESLEEVNSKTSKLLETNKNMTTTFLDYKYLPEFMLKPYLKYHFLPKITIHKDKVIKP